ncbi:MAG: FAD-dependent oxidoreductase [Polyangia bacterium]|jgi:quinone-modifying oxidoreductase subunit QmoA|nr:FAD-dependent oxidoreductase [Polyangia bacterium]
MKEGEPRGSGPEERRTLLVVGGGMAGITAAVEAAEAGCTVHLVEREAYLGGRAVRHGQYFPKLCPPTCGMEINFKRIKNNPRIHVHTMAEVTEVREAKGAYEVEIGLRPRYVSSSCTACGRCAQVCRTEIPNPFDYGMGRIKAAHLPHEMAFPMRYVLSPELVGTEDGAACQAACEQGAIDLEMTPEKVRVSCSSIIVATGWKPYDPARLEQTCFGSTKNLITNVMMERLLAPGGPTRGKILRPSDGREARSVAFCQCMGSRDERHLKYCSGVCCMASLKQAHLLEERLPDCEIHIFYIDLRAYGTYEELLAKVRSSGRIKLTRGKVGKITEDPLSGEVTLEAEDLARGAISRLKVDMAVLALGMVPSTRAEGIPGLELDLDADGFLVDGPRVFGAGCVSRPSDVAMTVQDSTGAALAALAAIEAIEAAAQR